MTELALIMPMAGRGSRFSALGKTSPKPLIEIDNRPFFWWAAESVRRVAPIREMVFVILEEHVATHQIDARIRHLYPDAKIVAISETTSGAAETAAIGIDALMQDGPIAINDCDHAFSAPGLCDLVTALSHGAVGALIGFASVNPAYSFARLADDDPGRVVATIEKECAGPFAIAGCYLFRDRQIFLDTLTRYRRSCSYPELFMSGLYDLLCTSGEIVRFQPLAEHLSFGTPEELARVSEENMWRLIGDRAA